MGRDGGERAGTRWWTWTPPRRWRRLTALRLRSDPSCTAAGTPPSAWRLRGGSRSYTQRPMKIGIVGLGYVGLPLAIAFGEAGHDVVGVDADARVKRRAGEGHSHVEDVPDEALAAIAERFHATSRYADLRQGRRDHRRGSDTAHPQPRARPSAADRCRHRAGRRAPARASWWCSSPPPIRARRASSSCRCSRSPASPRGRDFFAAFSPERIDPGRTDYTMRNTPKVVGGLTDECRAARSSCTARSATRSWRSRHRRRPSSPSCSRTSSAR